MTRIGILELVASSRGGGAVHVRDLAMGLDRARYAVRIAMPEDGGSMTSQDFAAAGIPFYSADIAGGFSRQALLAIRALVHKADILHVHGARAALFGRLAALSLGQRRPRLVYTIHGFAAPHYASPRRQVLLCLERLLAGVTDTWICVSHAEEDALLAANVAHANRVVVIRNGVDLTRFAMVKARRPVARKALDLYDKAFVVSTVCRLHRPRDFATLLEAFRRVREAVPHGSLLIVGDGPLRRQVEGEVSALGLQNDVQLLGTRRDVPDILAATDVFVLASQGWEGLPLTVLEAMASALPVVASDVGGTREAVTHEQSGYLFAPGDVAALAGYLITLAADIDLAKDMGQRGFQRVQESFTVERMVRQTTQAYERLLEV
jgi:glycosyltransferase involved in cell wall biosynthesis